MCSEAEGSNEQAAGGKRLASVAGLHLTKRSEAPKCWDEEKGVDPLPLSLRVGAEQKDG